LGSSESTVLSFDIGADLGDGSTDALAAMADALIGNTNTYAFSKKDIEKYRNFFTLGDDEDRDSLQIFEPRSDFDITSSKKSDNDNVVFVMSKRGTEIMEAKDPNTIFNSPSFQTLLDIGSLNTLKYSPFHGSLTFRGFSGLLPLHIISVEGSGNPNWDKYYRVANVKHSINSSNWSTTAEIIMNDTPA
jgi:hypothetical protein